MIIKHTCTHKHACVRVGSFLGITSAIRRERTGTRVDARHVEGSDACRLRSGELACRSPAQGIRQKQKHNHQVP